MKAKERVMRIINHKEADRVPMFMDCTTDDVLKNVIKCCGVKTEEEMLQKLHIDMRWCTCTQDCEPVNSHVKGTYVDMWGIEKTIYGSIPVSHPLANVETIADVEQYKNWPTPDMIDYNTIIKRMEQYKDYCVFGGMWGPFAEIVMLLLGTEKFMIMMYDAPEVLEYLLDKTCNFYCECNERIFEKAGDKMQIFFMGDDYGAQQSLLYSPQMWRKFVKPRLKKIYGLAKNYGYKVQQHSCGSIVDILEDMIEVGLDGIHPIQVTAKGMDPKALKDKFGKDLYFAGSIDAMRTLIGGTEESIEEEIKDRIQILGEGGGFIIGPSQGFLPEVPVENIIRLYKMAYQHGAY